MFYAYCATNATHVGEPEEDKNNEEKLDALAAVMLEENDDIKAEYAGYDMAEYLATRDDRLDAVAAKAEFEQTGDIAAVEKGQVSKALA